MALAFMSTVAVGVSAPAFAQDAAAGGYKIAVVDVQKVLQEYNKRKQKYDELQGKVNALQTEIDALSSKIDAAKKDYDAKKNAGTDSTTLINLETQIRKDYATYETKLKEHQATIDGMEKQVLQEVIGDVEGAIKAFGTSGNYHLILNAREGAGGAVVYHATALDATAQVIQQLNGGAAAAPAAAPAEGGKKKKN